MSRLRNMKLGAALVAVLGVAASMTQAQQNFDVVIMGDPQFFRTTDSTLSVNKVNALSLANNTWQMAAIRHYASQNSDYLGTVINGDLTEFGYNRGKWSQLDAFKSIYPESNFPGTLWPGLGNHDYANNVDDSWENNAAIRMVHYLDDYLGRFRANPGYIADDSRRKDENLTVRIEGSLSYAWDIGDYRFIQLNYYPDYAVTFKGWHWERPGDMFSRSPLKRFIKIESSIDNGWLEGQLDKAVTDGKIVILNMHHPYPDGAVAPARVRLNDLMKGYANIQGVFVAHLSEYLGQCRTGGQPDTIGNKVPVFYSGSPIYSTMLVAKFNSAHEMAVERYTTTDGIATHQGTAIKTCIKR